MKRAAIALASLSALALVACQNADEVASQQAPPAPMPAAEMPPAAAEPEPAPSAAAQGPQTTAEASLLSEPQWVVLFAGQDLSSFDTVGDVEWGIVEDYVESEGGTASFLVTRGAYTDFLLHAEFWTNPEANSGIFLRCQNPEQPNAEICYEVNIFDQNPNPDNRTGAIINHVPPMANIEAANQWNTFEITAQGPRIEVRLNGTLTAELEDDELASGPIGFQNNGGLVRFRNIRLRPL